MSSRVPMHRLRDYRLAKAFGYTPDQIDASSAIRLDWMLAIYDVDPANRPKREE